MHYVALLRGINIGGRNAVSMAVLAEECRRLGYTSVQTYINSGNVLFEHDDVASATLEDQLEQVIKATFGLTVMVVVLKKPELLNVAANLPNTWVQDATMKTDVMFLHHEINRPGILENLTIKPFDRVKYVPHAILWSVDRSDATRSGLQKLVGTEVYARMTIRNANTLRKLAALMG